MTRVNPRVVLLAGPSGTGKSHLADTLGLPVVRLDDFYRDGDDRTVSTAGAPFVVAEGIFADQIAQQLRDRDLLAIAVCIRHHRLVTFVRRLSRDLRERRKPAGVLVRRGLALLSDEPRVVRRCVDAGCEPLSAHEARARIAGVIAAARA